MSEEWRVENFCREAPEGGLEYVSGQEVWKNLFYGCILEPELEEWLCLPRAWCFLLSGESGVGKTYLARSFAAEMGQHGYHFLLLDGLDLTGDTEEESIQRIRSLFRTVSSGERFFLMIQGIERIRGEAAEVLFAGKLEELKEQDVPVIVVALTEAQEQILSALQRVFYICGMRLPDESSRTEYFKRFWSSSFLSRKPKFGAEKMAEITEGMNYTQLELVRLCVTGVMCELGVEKLKSVAAFRSAVEAGTIQLSEKRFRQITAAVRQGRTAVQIRQEMSEAESRRQEISETESRKQEAAKAEIRGQGISESSAAELLFDIDDDIPAPSW